MQTRDLLVRAKSLEALPVDRAKCKKLAWSLLRKMCKEEKESRRAQACKKGRVLQKDIKLKKIVGVHLEEGKSEDAKVWLPRVVSFFREEVGLQQSGGLGFVARLQAQVWQPLRCLVM